MRGRLLVWTAMQTQTVTTTTLFLLRTGMLSLEISFQKTREGGWWRSPRVYVQKSENNNVYNSLIIPQYDGNFSILSDVQCASSDNSTDQAGQTIQTIITCGGVRQDSCPPPVWYEQYTQRTQCVPVRQTVRQTVRRNSKLLQCLLINSQFNSTQLSEEW